ncbi:MAG: NAD-dependent succinate-semialdehyde dehydrogenase [Cyclobacteriaceae bacterium]|nr:NAD-dependent succinate-semialdehyde dehydrogenase [Cyclobacteriaceae bacterium]MCH8517653.1 NAD-dependent succinate-semialdehyde dehydrogenase [Cyclobacteriaceae bacterium]
MYQTENPYTLERTRSYSTHSEAEIEKKLSLGEKSFPQWESMGFGQRAECMKKMARLLEERKTDLAKIITFEMGKPLVESEAEIIKCALVCDYYAQHAADQLKSQVLSSERGEAKLKYQPLGAIFAVMPWNFPFWQVYRFAAPTLMAGNVAILKHAPNVPACAKAMEKIFLDAGFPKGVFVNLRLTNDQAAEVIKDRRVKAITLTGSTAAGSAVASIAASVVKKSVLELGGSDPFIVCEDADIDKAVKMGVKARYMNNGQSCIAAKRFILHEAIADEFLEKFIAAVKELTIGDPQDAATKISCMARADLAIELRNQVQDSLDQGARLLFGDFDPVSKEAKFPPLIIDQIEKGMRAYSEEFFGPVALVFRASSDQEALHIANDTSYGLGASVWTQDKQKKHYFAEEIRSGAVFINSMTASSPELPFGGIGESGYGRELSSLGIREFVNEKTIFMKE